MKVIVDTSVWSLGLRRRSPGVSSTELGELKELIKESRAVLVGPVRQELLSGIRETAQFEILKDRLRAFPDSSVRSQEYELAAEFFNRCRGSGIQGSNTDFLLCAMSVSRNQPIFSTDKDFAHYATVLGIDLYSPRIP